MWHIWGTEKPLGLREGWGRKWRDRLRQAQGLGGPSWPHLGGGLYPKGSREPQKALGGVVNMGIIWFWCRQENRSEDLARIH